jgi:hypothetical protein
MPKILQLYVVVVVRFTARDAVLGVDSFCTRRGWATADTMSQRLKPRATTAFEAGLKSGPISEAIWSQKLSGLRRDLG